MGSNWIAGSVIGICGCLLLADVAMAGPPAERLRSLYIRQSGPTWGGEDYISLEPVGDDVRVRTIRTEPASAECSELVVTATEQIIPHTTVQKLTEVPVCSLSAREVERAYKRAPDHHMHYDLISGVFVVLADCGGAQRTFVHLSPPLIDFDILKRIAPTVYAMWGIGDRLTGSGPITNTELGTSYAPMLLTGKYTELVPDYIVEKLKTYQGPPAFRGGWMADLVDRDKLPITTYVQPVFSQIAQSARISGDVRLRLTIDPASGAVTDAQALGEHQSPFLTPAAIDAARRWIFDPGKAPREPIDVTVSFHIRCATAAGMPAQ